MKLLLSVFVVFSCTGVRLPPVTQTHDSSDAHLFALCHPAHELPMFECSHAPLSESESGAVLRWHLARLIPACEGRGPAPSVTQTCQA